MTVFQWSVLIALSLGAVWLAAYTAHDNSGRWRSARETHQKLLHNRRQDIEMMMAEYLKMGDKQGQQRRRRVNGAVWSIADRSAVEENRALLPKPPKQCKGGRPIENRRVLEGIL